MLKDTIKWILILCVGAGLFYLVYPKYEFLSFRYRMNKITGTVEKFYVYEGWVNKMEKVKKRDSKREDIFDQVEKEMKFTDKPEREEELEIGILLDDPKK